MKIYIDESGNFQPRPSDRPSASFVGALVIPDAFSEAIFNEYSHLRATFPGDGEIKGSKLGEEHCDATFALLGRYPVILEACGMEMSIHSPDDLSSHKRRQAEAILNPIDRTFGMELVHDLLDLSDRIVRLSAQLYAQSVIQSRLVEQVLRYSTLYYSQFLHEELGSFSWIVDSKRDDFYSELSSFVVLPTLEWRFRLEPMLLLETGNYSYYDRFRVAASPEPRHDLKAIWRDQLVFADSKSSLGLELVDIAVNALRRAYRGNLQASGWHRLGPLLLKKEVGRDVIPFLSLSPSRPIGAWGESYFLVHRTLEETARHPFCRSRASAD